MKPSVRHELMQILFPSDINCIVCGREISPNRYCLCDECKLALNDNYCLRCGRHKVGLGDYCSECGEMHLSFDEARSAVNYDDSAKSLIHRLKFGNAAYLAQPLSQFMLDVLLLSDWDADCITFVPIHKVSRRKRGYNQAELLARAVAEHVDIPCKPLLDKIKRTPDQARLDRQQRLDNLKSSFAVIEKPPEHVILVDDVLTTGSTADECAKILKSAGAKVVYVLTFASVPERPVFDRQSRNIADFRR